MLPPAFRAHVMPTSKSVESCPTGTEAEGAAYLGQHLASGSRPARAEDLDNVPSNIEWADELSASPNAADTGAPQRSQYVVEAWNDTKTRGVRVTQRELSVIGTNKIVTKIEVIEREMQDVVESENVVFCVKHTHNVNCILANVECPIEVPDDSVKVFKSIDNPQHVHIYLERVIPHFRFQTLPSQVSAFWWRAVGHGSLVFQNWATGKVVALPCRHKGVPAAAETLQRAVTLLSKMPAQFFERDQDYAQINLAADEEAAANVNRCLDTLEHVAEAIQAWALEDGVSPWMTKLIVKARGSRKGQILQYRYSIGVDVAPASTAHFRPYLSQQGENIGGNQTLSEAAMDTLQEGIEDVQNASAATAQIYLAIQVHCNEPLSRELKAFPICMLPIAIEDFSFREVTALYLRSLWFLRKLFEYHQGTEEMNASNESRAIASKPYVGGPTFLRNIRAHDEKDLNARNKLAGGARLCHPKYVAASNMSRPRII